MRSEIGYRGQPIALVLGETLEAAIEGAETVEARYSEQRFASKIDSPELRREPAEEKKAGNGAAAFATAQTKIDQSYVSPTQHHNPIEMLATSATFENGRLTIYECTQHSAGVRGAVAATLRLDPERIDVKSPSVGGGFGQKTRAYGHSALVARGDQLRPPVKLVMPRSQIFHQATFRPESHHRVRLGADGTGKMIAAVYHAEHEQSQQGQFPAVVSRGDKPSLRHRELPRHGRQHSHRPAESGPYALPAPAPILLRVPKARWTSSRSSSVATRSSSGSPMTGAPIRSPATPIRRYLKECIEEGARRSAGRRTAQPGSMRLADGTQVGWGMASGAYPSMMVPAIATLRVGADGRSRFAASGHEMGQGIRTSIANVLIEGLGLDPHGSSLRSATPASRRNISPPAHGHRRRVPAAARAVDRMRAALRELLAGRSISGNIHRQLATVRRPIWKYR